MDAEIKPRYAEKVMTKTVLAVKAARLLKGLSRKDAAALCGCSPRSFEQLENGRCNFSEVRIRRLIERMGVQWSQFESIRKDPKKHLAQLIEQKPKERSIERKPRRNHYKIVTKEVRVIRILRMRKGISQHEASRLCGYVPGGFGHIEVGRTTITTARVNHILESLGYSRSDFELLMSASVLRDEVMNEAISSLQRLDDQALTSALTIIKALIK